MLKRRTADMCHRWNDRCRIQLVGAVLQLISAALQLIGTALSSIFRPSADRCLHPLLKPWCSHRAQIVWPMTKSEMASKILSVPRPGNFEVGSSKVVVVDDDVSLSLTNFIGRDSCLFSRFLTSTATNSKNTRKSDFTAQNM